MWFLVAHKTSEGIFNSQVHVWKGSHNAFKKFRKNESIYYHIMKVEYMVRYTHIRLIALDNVLVLVLLTTIMITTIITL